MSVIRRREYNKTEDEIKIIKKCLLKNNQSIKRFKNQKESLFIKIQIVKLDEKNNKFLLKLQELENHLEMINKGELDEKIVEKNKQDYKTGYNKSKVTLQKKKILLAEKKAKSKMSKAYYQAGRENARKIRRNKYSVKRSYYHFCKASSTIPRYMRRNLSSMPNNKGYFWKSVACFGERRRERGKPIVLFDRKRGGLLIIHEWTEFYYTIYHKKGRARKILISSTLRKN